MRHIMVLNAKGGCGKSTLATNIASYLATEGASVALADYDVSVLSMGNPHCVMQVADTGSADVARLGPLVESHERFPERANVGFMAIRGRKAIDLRVY